jgi:hypothetical protein
MATFPLAPQPGDLAVGDVDGDGDADVLVASGLGVRLLRNLGSFVFVDAGLLANVAPGGVINGLTFADLDGDLDRDLLLISSGTAAVSVFLNQGGGTFAAATPIPLTPGGQGFDLVATDVDRDGDLDAVVTEYPATQPLLFRNDGAANFTPANTFPPLTQVLGKLVVTDIDGDRAPDLLIPHPTHAALLHNDGTGTFRDETARLWSRSIQAAVPWDFDEDGDEDLLYRQGYSWQRVENRLRAATSLQTVRPGGQLQIRFQVQPVTPVPAPLVLPLAAFGPGAPVNFPGIAGSFLVPASATIVLGGLPVSGGTAQLAIAVPASSGFVGIELCVQGLVLAAGLQPGLTNVVDERILP